MRRFLPSIESIFVPPATHLRRSLDARLIYRVSEVVSIPVHLVAPTRVVHLAPPPRLARDVALDEGHVARRSHERRGPADARPGRGPAREVALVVGLRGRDREVDLALRALRHDFWLRRAAGAADMVSICFFCALLGTMYSC